MRKFLVLTIAVLLMITSAFSAVGEEAIPADHGKYVAVYYLNATKNNDQIKTAKYIIYALCAANDVEGGNMLISRIDGTDNPLTFRSTDGKSWTQKAWAQNQKLVNTGNGRYFNSESSLNEQIQTELSAYDADVWFVIPQDGYASFIQNVTIPAQLEQMLTNNPNTKIHLVRIGDDSQQPDSNAAISQIAAMHPEQIEWIRVASDFLVQNRDVNADGSIHTGDYFLASLFGNQKPADLTVDTDENGNKVFSLPEAGKILVLQRHQGSANEPTLTDENGEGRRNEKTFSLSYLFAGNSEINYTATIVAGLPEGKYALSGCADDTKVYWYPKFETVQPILDMGEAEWNWGSHTVSLSLGNTLHRPEDFSVYFIRMMNEESSGELAVGYNEEKQNWENTFEVPEEIKQVQIIPKAELRMKDGNQIWAWEGEPATRVPQSSGVKVKEDAETRTILYYSEEAGGTVKYKWNDFFEFNANETIEHSVERGDSVTEGEINISENQNGFSLTVINGIEKSGEGKIILHYGDKTQELNVTWKNVQDILSAVQFTTDSEKIKAGMEINLSAVISQNVREDWIAAHEQLGKAFPGIENLELTGKLAGNNWEASTGEKTEDKATFSGNEGEALMASVTITIPQMSEKGNGQLIYQVSDASGENILDMIKGATTVEIINTSPIITYEGEKKTEISLAGFPENYEGKDLQTALFGSGSLFNLFADEETEIKEIKITISNPVGLKLNDELLDENTTEWTTVVTDSQADLHIEAVKPADHEITLIASDGVNTSESLTIKVHVYSMILRIAMIVVAALAAILLILTVILIIRQARKPQFADIRLRCLVSSDENAEKGKEIMTKSIPVSMAHFGKKPATLTDLLVLARQPSIGADATEITNDITLLPTKHGEVNVLFGKKAMERIGRHEKRDLIPQNNTCRLRIDNQYIQIENVR